MWLIVGDDDLNLANKQRHRAIDCRFHGIVCHKLLTDIFHTIRRLMGIADIRAKPLTD
jgi:hypothetical protein